MPDAAAPLPGQSGGPRLQALELTCEKGDRLLFHELHLDVAPGQILWVRGPNGTGKTSLLRILAGLSLPTEGEVLWDGRPIRSQRWAFNASLAYVGHRPGIKDHLSALENLTLMLRLAAGPGPDGPDRVLERLGLGSRRHLAARLLSAGQRRRVALARLTLTRPSLWILDEPLTALDRAGVGLVEELLAAHVAAGGLAVLTSHHPLALPQQALAHLELGNG